MASGTKRRNDAEYTSIRKSNFVHMDRGRFCFSLAHSIQIIEARRIKQAWYEGKNATFAMSFKKTRK